MNFLQLVLILAYCALYYYDYWNIMIMYYGSTPICNGLIVGLIMGNPLVGLEIGATLQLMQLGGVGYGGASYPEYDVGTIIATIVCAAAGQGADFGLAIGLPVSLLMMQIDVLVKTVSTFMIHKAQSCTENGNDKGAFRWLLSGLIPWSLKPMLPVLLLFILGPEKVADLVNMMPDFIIGALSVAGNMLPAVGIAILMRYMNVKEYFIYLILGYAMMGYFNLPMIGIALFGFVVAYLSYKGMGNPVSVAAERNTVSENVQIGADEDEL